MSVTHYTLIRPPLYAIGFYTLLSILISGGVESWAIGTGGGLS